MRFSGVILIIVIVLCKCNVSEFLNETQVDYNQQDVNDTAQIKSDDSSCAGSLTNLTINQNQSSGELNLRWELTTLDKCQLEYRVQIETFQPNNNFQIPNIKTKFIDIRSGVIKPCSTYNITLELLQSDNQKVLSTLSDTWETDAIGMLAQVEKLNIITTTNSIRLSWKPYKYASICKIRYVITSTSTSSNKDIPYFRYVNRTVHWIKNLHSCTQYNVSVIPSSILLNKFADESFRFMHVVNTLPEQINNLTLEVQSDGTNISWVPPDNHDCIQKYLISSEKFNETTTSTYFKSNANLYCTSIEVTAVTVNNDTGDAAKVLKPGPVRSITSSSSDTSVTISWKPPEDTSCVLDYSVQLLSGLETFTNTTDQLNHIFENLISCTDYDIIITTRSIDETLGDDTFSQIKTLPPNVIEKVLNLSINKWTISWEPPPNVGACAIRYMVQVYNDQDKLVYDEKTAETHHEINYNSWLVYCIMYRITVRATIDLTVSEPAEVNQTYTKELGPVRNINSLPRDTSITISWEPPEDASCVLDYFVQLIGESEMITTATDITFENLIQCMEYEFIISARSSNQTLGESSSNKTKTVEPNDIEQVKILDVSDWYISWKPPPNVGVCNVSYTVQVLNDKNEDVYSETTEESYHEIDSTAWFVGCMPYKILVTANLDSTVSEPAERAQIYEKETNPPTCHTEEINQTWALFTCELDNYDINMCKISEIVINCEVSDCDGLICNRTTNKEYEDDHTRPSVQIQVDNISAFTRYTCSGVVVNSAGRSVPSKYIEVQTEEGVPDPPYLEEITEITNKSFKIRWREPENLNGILLYYNITILSDGPVHYVPDECLERGNSSYIVIIDPPTTNEFKFGDAFPSYRYYVSIQAATQVGSGLASETKEIQTEAGIPAEPPSNVNFMPNQSETENYSVNVSVTWTYPCDTNGEVKYFEVDVIGISYADEDVKQDKRNAKISVNEKNGNLDYEYIIANLEPAFVYAIYIKVVAINENLYSDQVKLNYSSPESRPEACVLKPIVEPTNQTFMLEWEKPPRKNGILLNYTIQIIDEGPEYWMPENEECDINKSNYSLTVPPDETTLMFEFGIPHHRYTTFINTATMAGNGPPSEEMTTQTLESEPETVRNQNIKLTNLENEVYDVKLILSFKHPCNIYGTLKEIKIILLGNRPNSYLHKKEFVFKDNLEEYELATELRAEYNYTLTIQVKTENYQSKIIEEEFSSPSGVPPVPIKNITAPIPLDSTTAQYVLDRNLFDEQYGDILYYAFIMGEFNREEESKYGFWKGDNESWPGVCSNLISRKWMKPYQATPNYWNPFENESDDSYTFIIGDTNRSEFNQPLQEGIMYTFKVRAFTQNGYRDSLTVTFQLPVTAQLGLILGIIFGIFGTGFLLGAIFVLWRKRQQWTKKKESIKSILPLTPLPVTIKQFPEYYDELKDNSDKLQHEFGLLGTSSNDVTLPSYDGLLPDNKKKNRYTNIIPYDETRVKLIDTNDNYFESDYINASYIQGYSGSTEYIATQGPLERTCLDFWKMVIQENSSLIVMVAQFVEKNKDKCYKYFPDNHENMELENGIAIRCCTELNFKTHAVRTLLVQKDLEQWTVTHLQFMDWPDFGCPTGSDVVLEFCQIMREYADKNPDPIIIHCSAGVGRTGTLIALDILLQAIDHKQDIDIFGTVLNLRRDRKNMVQTEKQYLYIHDCINDAIENPMPIQYKMSTDPIYENLEEIKSHNGSDIEEIKMNQL